MRAIPKLLLAFALTLAPAALVRADKIDPNNPPQGRFADVWMEIHLGGSKVGYGHDTVSREGDLIHTRIEMHLKIGRAEVAVNMTTIKTTTETVRGVPVAFSWEQQISQISTRLEGKITDGRVDVTQTQLGMEQKAQNTFPEGAVMCWGAFRETLLRGFEPGTEYKLPIYLPSMSMDTAIESTTRISGREKLNHRGQDYDAIKMIITMVTPMGSMESTAWLDEDGNMLKMEMQMPGLGNMQMITVGSEVALADFVPPEMFMNTVLKVDPIDIKAARSIKYRITSTTPGAGPLEFPETDMQSVETKPDGSVELTVTRLLYDPSKDPEPKFKPDDLAEFTGKNLMMNTDDPELKKLADRAAGGVTEPFALADKLRRFVSEYINDKNLTIGFATASEVCRRREGDCSEHGVLLAALGRIKGLPSRVVVGVAYFSSFGGQQDIFGYHLWTQFLIEGRWYDFDASLRESNCSPARIAFAVSSLKDAGLADLSLPLMSKIGAIKLEVIEIK